MMAARAPFFHDDDIRLTAKQGVDQSLERTLRKMQSAVADALQATGIPTLTQLEWVDDTELSAEFVAQVMAECAEEYRVCAAAFADRPGEEALDIVAALRGMAAWADERQADALEIVASTRRLRGRYLWMLAGAADEMEPEDLVCYAANDFLCFLSKEMDGGNVPNARDTDAAARADAVDAAARAGGVGARFTERFLTLAKRVRYGGALYAELPGLEALTEALRRLAASVEALCANPDDLVAKMLASEPWILWRTLNLLRSMTAIF